MSVFFISNDEELQQWRHTLDEKRHTLEGQETQQERVIIDLLLHFVGHHHAETRPDHRQFAAGALSALSGYIHLAGSDRMKAVLSEVEPEVYGV